MVICPDCGKEVTDAKFCSNCGSALPKADEIVAEEVENKVDEAVEEVQVEESADVEEIEDVPEEVVVEEEPAEEPVEEVPEEVINEEPVNVVKKSKFCSNCGTEIDEGTVFCPQCGFRLIGEEKPQTKFCQSCGEKININAEICPHCGVRVAGFSASEEKNALLSAILSVIFPGLGHIYLGLNKKGISFIVAYIVSAVLVFLVIGFILIFIVWIWALIDSIKATEAINRGEYVEDKLF